MRRVEIESGSPTASFTQAQALADRAAEQEVGEAMELSWYDRARDLMSPRGAEECHDQCPTPAYIDYAQHRGGDLVVDIDRGAYVFCYRSMASFD